MGNENVKILDFEDKKGSNGAYVRFQTDQGWLSCFDNDYGKELKKKVGFEAVVVGVVEKKSADGQKTFRNIVKPKELDKEIEEAKEEFNETQKPNHYNKYKLTAESCRLGALQCAISVHVNNKIAYTPEHIIELAKPFLEYIQGE